MGKQKSTSSTGSADRFMTVRKSEIPIEELSTHLNAIEGILSISSIRELGFITKYKGKKAYAKYTIDIKHVYDMYGMSMDNVDVTVGNRKIDKSMIYPSAECESKIIESIVSRVDTNMLDTIAKYYEVVEVDLSVLTNDSSGDELLEKLYANSKYANIVLGKKIIEYIRNEHVYNKLYIIYIEVLDVQIDQFINYNCTSLGWNLLLDIIVFKMVYTLYVMNHAFGAGGFMHNDIHEGNVMIKYDDDYVYEYHKKIYDVYEVDGKEYWIPYMGFTVKLIDFGYSMSPEDGIYNAIVLDKTTQISQWPNDIISFIETIMSTCPSVESYAGDLFTRLDADGKWYSLDSKGEYIEVTENMSYIDFVDHMMHNPEWDRFRCDDGDDRGVVHRRFRYNR